jgi:hypothetical protein
MGGFVARALFVHPAFRPGTVDTIITLNTPHRYTCLLLTLKSKAALAQSLIASLLLPLLRTHTYTRTIIRDRLMPLLLHRSVADLYHKVNGFWRQQFNLTHFRLNSSWDTFPRTPSTFPPASLAQGCVTTDNFLSGMADVTVLSIAGSFRDTLVRSDLASLETLVPISHGLSLLTTSVPGVRLEADHQVIVLAGLEMVLLVQLE